jgi:hypothetical protein
LSSASSKPNHRLYSASAISVLVAAGFPVAYRFSVVGLTVT